LDDRITALESFVDSFSPVQVIGTNGYEFEFYVPDTVDYPYVGTPAYWTEVTIGSDSGIMQIV